MAERPTALVVMPVERSREPKEQFARVADIETAGSCEEAAALLRSIPHISLVLTDLRLPDGVWFDVLNLVGDVRPEVKVVVCARVADERLWVQVIEAGGFDVLVEPYQDGEVQRILAAATSTARPPSQAGRAP